MFELTLKNTNEFDKTYMIFCKQVLSVHSNVCNFAVINELGQFPHIISIVTTQIAWQRWANGVFWLAVSLGQRSQITLAQRQLARWAIVGPTRWGNVGPT